MFPSSSPAAAPLLAPRPCWLDFDDNSIPVAHRLLDVDLPFLERKCSEPVLLEERSHRFLTAENANPGDAQSGWVEDNLGREEPGLDHGIGPAPVEHVEEPPHNLYVLLRHAYAVCRSARLSTPWSTSREALGPALTRDSAWHQASGS